MLSGKTLLLISKSRLCECIGKEIYGSYYPINAARAAHGRDEMQSNGITKSSTTAEFPPCALHQFSYLNKKGNKVHLSLQKHLEIF